MTYMKSVEAGADIIDTAMSPFALGTSQPATEVMVETFKGTPYDTGLDQKLLSEIADYFRPIRDEALESGLLNPKNLGVNIKTLLYQVPGGMLAGKYGATVKPVDAQLQKKILGENAEIITCRPADLIPNELDTLRKECEQWIQQDEDVLTYALFPQVAVDFFKYRQAQQTKVDAAVADTKNGAYPV